MLNQNVNNIQFVFHQHMFLRSFESERENYRNRSLSGVAAITAISI